MEQTDCFSSYTYSEGKTGGGQLVEFTCPPEAAADVKAFLQQNVRTINPPTTYKTKAGHGAYGMYSRYSIKQHRYAGGGPDEGGSWGYIEILEIKNPPDGRWGIIINECTSLQGGVFSEWETLKQARAAFTKCQSTLSTENEFPKLPGFKRRVVCGALRPWFYAIGDEELIGDYSFPDGCKTMPYTALANNSWSLTTTCRQ